MKTSGLTKLLAMLLLASILFGSLSAAVAVNAATDTVATVSADASDDSDDSDYKYGYTRSVSEIKEMMDAKLYSEYKEKYADIPDGKSTITINCATDYVADETTAEVEVYKNYEGVSSALYMGDEGKTTFTVTVPEDGMYAISFVYYPIEGTRTTMERTLYIDGHIPFSEARYLYLPRPWSYVLEENEDGELDFDKDINGNDIRPVREMAPSWQDYYLRDWLGFTQDPFEFYFTAGTHTITLEANREPMVISEIKLYPYEEEPTYQEVLEIWESEGIKVYEGDEVIKVQAEKPTTVSVQNIFPANDRTSSLTEPQDPTCIRYNYLDCSTCTQWVRCEVEVPEDALYQINVRFRQNGLVGMFTSRRVRINGEVQFREASYCRFVYDTAFQVEPLNNGEQEFLFHLNKGTNVIEFEVVLGDLADVIYEIRDMVEELNEAYTKILMITGPSPDSSRDYGFSRIVPDAITSIAKAAKRLYELSDEIVSTTGEKGDQAQALETYAMLFKKMAADEYEIAGNLTNFKNYVVNLSNWMYNCLSQPLKMDYFTIQSPNTEKPKAVANFFESMVFEVKAFIGSFTMDYTTIGFRVADDVEYDDELTIWATSDRETMLIQRRIIDSGFTPEYNVGVTIKVISAGLTEAIIAGIGPDISYMSSTDTITWGLRTAVEPLNDFEGFEETIALYPEAATIPLTLYGVTFGLPESMSFNMMFYRVDVLTELGLDIPKTWDDLYTMLSVLQNKHLEIGMPISLAGTNIFLYQSGTELYTENGLSINLDSNEALSAFESLTDFFSKYSSPAVWEITRFRSGEIPVMIADAITTYNTLMTYYDLRGLWEMAPLCGTVQEDGTINNTSVTTVTSIIIPRGANNPETSWKFLRWKASVETQTKLKDETIAVSQPTTKVNTANLQVFLDQPWTTAEREAITTQINSLAAVPEYPGGYIVSVYVNNAFYDVYNNGTEATTAMLDRVLDINREITRKRKEFANWIAEHMEVSETEETEG